MNGLNIIGDTRQPAMIVVESELDAYAIDYVAHDIVCAVAVGSNIKNPDNITDLYAKKTARLLICHDNDIAGVQMLKKWKHLYPHARAFPTPIGKDIGEAIQQGLNIQEWLHQNGLR
jgi:DNA primase